MKLRNLFLLIALSLPVCLSAQTSKQIYLQRADSLLQQILTLYKVEKYGLLTETYPRNPEQRITYTANTGAVVNQQEVSFLWPYSALVSGCVSLYKVSGQKKYRKLMDRQIKPGLDLYWDSTRIPHCYQSYPAFAGHNDRYYDDNDWVAIDFCDYYERTGDKEYLEKPSSCMTIFIPDGPKSWGEESIGANRRKNQKHLFECSGYCSLYEAV